MNSEDAHRGPGQELEEAVVRWVQARRRIALSAAVVVRCRPRRFPTAIDQHLAITRPIWSPRMRCGYCAVVPPSIISV
jgi:hypothetical protein